MTRAATLAAFLASVCACYDARLVAIDGDAGSGATPPASLAWCVAGGFSEREPNDDAAHANESAAAAICGSVAASDVDDFVIPPNDAGTAPAITVERVGGDGGLRAALLVQGTEITSGTLGASAGSVALNAADGTTGDVVVEVRATDATGAEYVIHVAR